MGGLDTARGNPPVCAGQYLVYILKLSSELPKKIVLDNGLRLLIHSDSRFETASIAICVLGGLRSETKEQAGITHLLEHLLFKRTETRTPFQIARTMDLFGGGVNGFTDAETLCLHADVPVTKLADAIELFADMMLTSNFSEDDFEKEREVVRQELMELIDDPSDTAYRNFCEVFWPKSMLALPVCGTEDSLAAFTPDDIREHLKKLLVGGRIIIGIGGGVDSQVCEELVRKNFSCLPSGQLQRLDSSQTSSGLVLTSRAVSQVHFVLGATWPTLSHPKHTAADAIISVVGEGMSSRLFHNLRDESGLVYDIECSAESFLDTASFEISGIVDRPNLEEVLEIIQSEIRRLRESGVSREELEHVCEVFSAEIAMEKDSIEAGMWRAIETEVLYGHFVSSDEDFAALCAVTPEDCSQLLQEFLQPGSFAASFAGDVEDLVINEELTRWCSPLQ